MKKKALTIIIIVAVLASYFVAFSATYDLQNVFLTRDEWESFESSMNEKLPNLEENKQNSIQNEVGYQMYRRGVLAKDVLQSMASDPAASSRLDEWSSRRAKELEDMTSIAPPSP